jgi:tRNA (guanine37-N1)-methyltransferase
MRIDVVTVFPEYLAPLQLSLIGKAQTKGLLQVAVHDLRNWASGVHKSVDDTPFGGGAGMVMRPDVWGSALDALLPSTTQSLNDDGSAESSLRAEQSSRSSLRAQRSSGPSLRAERSNPVTSSYRDAGISKSDSGDSGSSLRAERSNPVSLNDDGVHLVFPSPSGDRFTQRTAETLAQAEQLIFACGRYEGIDARVAEHYRQAGFAVSELSIGDYVLNGGEVATMVMIEAIARLLPEVIGNPESLAEESFGAAGLLEYPNFTKPQVWRDLAVPEVLLSGHHAQIKNWRQQQALELTRKRRPDLLD